MAVTALTMPVVIAILSLCIDLGFHYLAQSRAALVAGYAAETAVQRLSDCPAAEAAGRAVALEMISDMGFVDGYEIDVSCDGSAVRADVAFSVDAVLADIFGFSLPEIRAVVDRPL